VTGAAGFVGSHIVDRLVTDGWSVVAADSITPYYSVEQKESNLAAIASAAVDVVDLDLAVDDLSELVADVDVVFHQAGQPGVRDSWEHFASYVEHNVIATERLLRAVRQAGCRRLVYASSSSVYGDALSYPTEETTLPRPKSPYGVTKLSAEHLCGVYARNFGLSTVSLRYFTVFGPRQRPDMAMHRLFEAALGGAPFPKFGSGEQVRDFTYVGDVVEANIRAALADVPAGAVVNVAGGGSVTLNDVIGIVERLCGSDVPVAQEGDQAGDVERTGGSIALAHRLLDWEPAVDVEEGLARQYRWHVDRRSAGIAG
jgi:nucleoside-diphosphate-sugar epimerase